MGGMGKPALQLTRVLPYVQVREDYAAKLAFRNWNFTSENQLLEVTDCSVVAFFFNWLKSGC